MPAVCHEVFTERIHTHVPCCERVMQHSLFETGRMLKLPFTRLTVSPPNAVAVASLSTQLHFSKKRIL